MGALVHVTHPKVRCPRCQRGNGNDLLEKMESIRQSPGLEQGRRTTLQKLLEARFGRLSPGAQGRLASLSPERLEALTAALLKAQSLQELGLED